MTDADCDGEPVIDVVMVVVEDRVLEGEGLAVRLGVSVGVLDPDDDGVIACELEAVPELEPACDAVDVPVRA